MAKKEGADLGWIILIVVIILLIYFLLKSFGVPLP